MTLAIAQHISFYSAFLIAGILQGGVIFVSLLGLFSSKPRLLPHCLLATLILVFVLELIAEFLYETGYQLLIHQFIYFEVSLDFLYGPLVYLYTISLLSPCMLRWRWVCVLHFIPSVLSFLTLLPMLLIEKNILVAFSYDLITHPNMDHVNEIIGWLEGLAIIQMAVYLALSIRALYNHRRKISNEFSNLDKVALNWLVNLLLCLSTLYGIYLIQNIGEVLFDQDILLSEITYISIIIVIYLLAYKGLHQSPILFQSAVSSPEAAMNIKYAKSAINDQQIQLLLSELKTYMLENKPYLDGDLTLPQLAIRLNLSTNHLSQVINDGLGTNFYHFINQ